MARLVLAQGTSHSPQLAIDPSQWGIFEERDRSFNPLLDRNGQRQDFESLLQRRGDELADQLKPEMWAARKASCDEALDRLRQEMANADPDYVVIVGDDQYELLEHDNLPAILIYRGETITATGRKSPDKLERQKNNRVRELAEWAYSPETDTEYPVGHELSNHLIASLNAAGFDLAQSVRRPRERGVGHAFGFPVERIFDKQRPIVPVMLNTFFPPNQPTPARCLKLGEALRQAIESFGDDSIKVAVMASGGLSHHLIDEELDRNLLAAMQAQDLAALAEVPAAALEGGTSEVRNWITMVSCAQGLKHSWSVYEPLYRSLAGTGCGMAFATWS